MNVILDSNIYELADSQYLCEKEIVNHFEYLIGLIDFLKKNNLKNNVLCSLDEYCAISNMENHPWNQYSIESKPVHQYNMLPIVFKDFLQLINYDNDIKQNLLLPAIPEFEMKYSSRNNSVCHNEFLKHITEIEKISEYIVFMGTANQDLSTPLCFKKSNDDKIYIEPMMDVNDINVICFSEVYRNLLLIDRNAKPSIDKPLPNADICECFYKIKDDMIRNGGNRVGVYKKIVHEIALRNGYYENTHLSSLNSTDNKIRKIYTSNSNPTIHICTDVMHGTIEVCNHIGKHQGECSYSGEYFPNSKDTTGRHDIIV